MSESVLKMQFDEIRIVAQTCLSIWLGFIKGKNCEKFIDKTTDKSIKWIISFSPMLLKVILLIKYL